MSNGFKNPYATSDPLNLEDFFLHGEASKLQSKIQGGWHSGEYGKWIENWDKDRPWEVGVGDLSNLSKEQMTQFRDLIPGDLNLYNYSGLGSNVNDALDRVFGDYIYDVGSFDFNTGATTEQDLRDWAGLEAHDVSYNPNIGSNYTERHNQEIEDAGLGIRGKQTIDFFDQDSIANALNILGGFEEGAGIDSSEVLALNYDDAVRSQDEYYAPLLDETRETARMTLADSLAKDITGNLAASGGTEARRRRAKMQYGSELSKIIEYIIKEKAKHEQNLISQAYDWKEQLEDRKGSA